MAEKERNFSGSPCERNSERHRTLISSLRESKTALPAYFRKGREGDVLDALEAVEADVMLGRPVRWNAITSLVDAVRVSIETAPDRLNFAKELLGLLERHRCRDIRPLWVVFQQLVYVAEPCYTRLARFIEFEKIFCTPYGKEKSDTDLVHNAVKTANLGLLKLQLKFGMGMMLASTSEIEMHIERLLCRWDEMYADGTFLMPLTRNNIDTVKENVRRNFNPESFKRLSFVFRMLDVSYGMSYSHPMCREGFVECYKLLLDSIPEPFVTSAEVKAILEKCLPASCSPLIPRISEDFKTLPPELDDVPQPRSLKHLSRIRVRQSLRRNLNLPHGVASLPLPTKLKKHILLNDDGDYSFVVRRYRWNATHSKQEVYSIIPERDDYVTSFIKSL